MKSKKKTFVDIFASYRYENQNNTVKIKSYDRFIARNLSNQHFENVVHVIGSVYHA